MSMLVVGIVLMVGGLAFAVYPFLRMSANDGAPQPVDAGGAGGRSAPRAVATGRAPSPVDDALATEREELALDRAMGKLSDEDYTRMLAALEARARRAARAPGGGVTASAAPVAAAATSGLPGAVASAPMTPAPVAPAPPASLAEEAERLVRAERASVVTCPECGPRPEPGARFCSSCGTALGGCPRCGAEVREPTARFCDQCGTSLKA